LPLRNEPTVNLHEVFDSKQSTVLRSEKCMSTTCSFFCRHVAAENDVLTTPIGPEVLQHCAV
jgi:hypothetical protein